MIVPHKTPASMVLATSHAVASIPGLGAMLGARVVRARSRVGADAATAVLAWGRKPSVGKAQRVAKRLRLPLLRLEDGFLRSVGLGRHEPPLSVVVDDLGIYYDATKPSRIEALISASHTDEQRSRALLLLQHWRSARVSKYNQSRELNWSGSEFGPTSLGATERLPGITGYVLAVDQTRADASIRYGLSDAGSFKRMLEAALAENPDCTVVLKVHPEVIAGHKQGYFDLADNLRHPRVKVLGKDAHPVSLIEHARAVYVVTSQLGFEGLLWGKRVRTFGMPFYAGWGLTEDDVPAPDRRRSVSIEDLVHGALVEYPRYLDPESARRCEPERVISWMALQRRMRERFPSRLFAHGFSLWKKPLVRAFFQGSAVRFVRDAGAVAPGSHLVVWGRKEVKGPAPAGIRMVRLEDGFLRSVGLGVDLVRPISWIADRSGLYYDATGPSDLERILETAAFEKTVLERARSLRERIVALGLTKYNVGRTSWRRRDVGRRMILVPGQVESDASIRFGAPQITTNAGLLAAVRSANPEAHIVYKPHPDVVAGLRRKGAGEDDAGMWCDELVLDAGMHVLLDAVDEVHTLTSLTGFEALLRGKTVSTYGQPFYAGWGLTHDMVPIPRRTRRLTLDELVSGVLIEYPMYVSRVTGRFTSPERALDELVAWRERHGPEERWWRRSLRLALRIGALWR